MHSMIDADDGSVGSSGGRAKGSRAAGGKRKRIRPQHLLVEAEAECAALQQQLQQLQGEVHSKHGKLQLIEMAVAARNVQIAHLGMLFPDILKSLPPQHDQEPSSSMDLDEDDPNPCADPENTLALWETRHAAVTRIFGSLEALKSASPQQLWEAFLKLAQNQQLQAQQQSTGNNAATEDGRSATSGSAAIAAGLNAFVPVQQQQGHVQHSYQQAAAQANTSSASNSQAGTSEAGASTGAARSAGVKMHTSSSATSKPPIKTEPTPAATTAIGYMIPTAATGSAVQAVSQAAAGTSSNTAGPVAASQGTLADLATALPLVLLANPAALQLVGNAACPTASDAPPAAKKSDSHTNTLNRSAVSGSPEWWGHVLQLLLLQPKQLQLLACLHESLLQGWLVQQQQGHLQWAACLKKLLKLETHRKAQGHGVTMGGAYIKQGELVQESNKLLANDQRTLLLALEVITSHILTPDQVQRLLWACLPGLPDPMALSNLAATYSQAQQQQQQQQLQQQQQQQQQQQLQQQ